MDSEDKVRAFIRPRRPLFAASAALLGITLAICPIARVHGQGQVVFRTRVGINQIDAPVSFLNGVAQCCCANRQLLSGFRLADA